MFQPKPKGDLQQPAMKIRNDNLKVVDKFCYLGGLLSQNARIDDEVTARIAEAIAAFGRLQKRVWSDHGIRLTNKVAVNRTVVLSTLLYGCESWAWYSDHVKKLDQFHFRCLRKICGISWRDKVPNTSVQGSNVTFLSTSKVFLVRLFLLAKEGT